MTSWNPSAPAVLGPEFLGVDGSYVSPTLIYGWAQRFRSNSAETIAGVRLHGTVTTGLAPARMVVEIVDPADEVDDAALTQESIAPNTMTLSTGAIYSGTVADVDEWPPTPDFVSIAPETRLLFQFDTAAIAPTGRIVSETI